MLDKFRANTSLKVVSLIIAVVLWFVVLGSRNVEVSKEVPVEIITPADLVVANEVPDKVAFRLSGPKAFLRNVLNRKEDPIRVNLSTAKAGLVTYRFFSDNIQVPIGVKVLSINPTAIIVKLEHLKRKEIPVKLLTQGEVPSGFRLTRLELVRSTVKIRGAESRVDQVVEAPTMGIDLSQIRESGEREVAIDLSKLPGILIDGDLPKIQFEVVQSTANFKIRNADIKVLTNRKFALEPKEATIFVRCSPEELKTLDRSKAYAIADLRNKGPGTYNPALSVQLPSNIKLIKVLPSKVKVTLQ
ncbi:MAG: CdaR family protein [Bdellovibrionota bacterium]